MKMWSSIAKFHVKYLCRPSTANPVSVEAVKVGFSHITVAMGALVLIPMTL